VTKYTAEQFRFIIRGYRMLDHGGALSSLLHNVSRCRECHQRYRGRADLPHNLLVRPLPLPRLRDQRAMDNYLIRVKRDDGHLRNLLCRDTPSKFLDRVQSARFSIGLLPWLDRCMLDRTSSGTAMMVVGIDFKHLSALMANPRDRHFPLDSDRTPSNVWRSTWRRFWRNLLDPRDFEADFVEFLRRRGAYFTNSVLCLGGASDPRSHSWDYIEACRPHIEQQIRIVRPRCLVSFGDQGCRNVAAILVAQNSDSGLLSALADSPEPLRLLRGRPQREARSLSRLRFGREELAFVPLYQPAWSHAADYRSDYGLLREVLGLSQRW
jgi:uracil-DNA glycosylase